MVVSSWYQPRRKNHRDDGREVAGVPAAEDRATPTRLRRAYGDRSASRERAGSRMCRRTRSDRGPGTNTLPNATAIFLPADRLPADSRRTRGADGRCDASAGTCQRRLLEACASQLALALERDHLAIDAAEARIQAESEQVRSALLSSVSPDLRTPLATIAGASSSLLEARNLDETTRHQLLETLADEATWLCRLLENILQMSRLDAGNVRPNKQWHVLEEIVAPLSSATSRELRDRP